MQCVCSKKVVDASWKEPSRPKLDEDVGKYEAKSKTCPRGISLSFSLCMASKRRASRQSRATAASLPASHRACCQVARSHCQLACLPGLRFGFNTHSRDLRQLGILLLKQSARDRMIRPNRLNVTLVINHNKQIPNISARVEKCPQARVIPR